MSNKILEIKGQRLSTVICNFFRCKNCNIVDQDMERTRYDYKCPNCNKESQGAQFYFPLGIPTLIDLMQEFYHIETTDESPSNLQFFNKKNHQLAVVIFFCSLGELLFEHFLRNIMFNQSIPYKLQDKLLSDVSIKKRIELYSILTNVSFEKDIKKLNYSTNLNYFDTYRFYINVREKRNQFLHSGRAWAIPKSMPKNCLLKTYSLVHLFVDLHNKYLITK